jgi:hypothetical protein
MAIQNWRESDAWQCTSYPHQAALPLLDFQSTDDVYGPMTRTCATKCLRSVHSDSEKAPMARPQNRPFQRLSMPTTAPHLRRTPSSMPSRSKNSPCPRYHRRQAARLSPVARLRNPGLRGSEDIARFHFWHSDMPTTKPAGRKAWCMRATAHALLNPPARHPDERAVGRTRLPVLARRYDYDYELGNGADVVVLYPVGKLREVRRERVRSPDRARDR